MMSLLIWMMIISAGVFGGIVMWYVFLNRVKEMVWKHVLVLAGLFYASWILAVAAVIIREGR